MNDKFMMGQGLGHQLEQAFARNDWTPELVNRLTSGNTLDQIKDLLEGRLTLTPSHRSWVEKDGVITFEVTSTGLTGPEWITHLEAKGYEVTKWAKDLLRHKDFVPTTGKTYKVAVLKGNLWKSNDRTTANIREEAKKRKLLTPPPELSPLIRDKFSNEDLKAMGLSRLITMHEPIIDSVGVACLLASGCDGFFGTEYDGPSFRWDGVDSFAFLLPQD